MILDAYLIDGKPTVVPRGYETLETNLKALKRHLGDLEPDHLTKDRIRFYRRQRTSDLRLHAAHHPADGPGRWSHRLGLRTGRGAAPCTRASTLIIARRDGKIAALKVFLATCAAGLKQNLERPMRSICWAVTKHGAFCAHGVLCLSRQVIGWHQ